MRWDAKQVPDASIQQYAAQLVGIGGIERHQDRAYPRNGEKAHNKLWAVREHQRHPVGLWIAAAGRSGRTAPATQHR